MGRGRMDQGGQQGKQAVMVVGFHESAQKQTWEGVHTFWGVRTCQVHTWQV